MTSRQKIDKIFGERLHAARTWAGFTQVMLAKDLDVSEATISHWENARNIYGVNQLWRIHEILQVPIKYLLGEQDDITTHEESEPEIDVFADQTEANDPIREFIRKDRPNAIFLIQYSSNKVEEALNIFRRYAQSKDSPQIFLLIKHPGTKRVEPKEALELNQEGIHTIDKFQFDKIRDQLRGLLKVDPTATDPKLHVRCYYAPGAMRAIYVGYPPEEKLRKLNPEQHVTQTGRNIGLLSLSMYRYTGKEGGVVGYKNPLIHAKSNTEKGKTLYPLFEEAFIDLWDNSEPGKVVLERIDHL